jgi:hypothetical protein
MNGSEAPEYQKRMDPTVVNGHNLEVGNLFFGTKGARDLPRNRSTNKNLGGGLFGTQLYYIHASPHIESHVIAGSDLRRKTFDFSGYLRDGS